MINKLMLVAHIVVLIFTSFIFVHILHGSLNLTSVFGFVLGFSTHHWLTMKCLVNK